MDWQIIWQANELKTLKVTPSLVKTEQTFAWTTGKILGYWTCHLHHCASSTSQRVLCIQEIMTYHRPLYMVPLSPLLCCMSPEPHEESVAQRLNVTDGRTWQWGKHFDTNILTHASACIQMHNQTQCHANMFLYICIVYQRCIVSDAVICMLTCRWNVTIIHKGGCAGRPSHWIDSLNQCKLLVSFTSSYFYLRKSLFLFVKDPLRPHSRFWTLWRYA